MESGKVRYSGISSQQSDFKVLHTYKTVRNDVKLANYSYSYVHLLLEKSCFILKLFEAVDSDSRVLFCQKAGGLLFSWQPAAAACTVLEKHCFEKQQERNYTQARVQHF
jgi:hypothetical protein